MSESIRQLWHEHVQAARRLAKQPAFTAVVALTLGVAIGGNAAIYSVVSGVLLKPLPYPEPERLVRVFAQHPRFVEMPVTPADFEAFRQQTSIFAGAAAFFREGHEFRGSAGPENLEGLFVTSGYFELLGARAALGRTFTREDERPGVADRVVLSDRIWRTRLGANPSIVGTTVYLSRRPFEVVGVAAPGLAHVGGRRRSLPHGETADFWIPLPLNTANLNRQARALNMAARLQPDVTLEQANAELDRLSRLREQQWPDSHANWRANAVPLVQDIVGAARPMLLAVSVAVGCVLLIACGNVACLTLARSIARAREHAVRAALGATRVRLAREILIESWILALLGAGVGGPLALVGVPALLDLAPPHLPRLHAISVDAGMFGFGIGITLITSALCGVLPAWSGARTNLEQSLRESGRTESPGARSLAWHGTLVAAQIALCFVLLVCAGLLARSFHRLQQDPIGFRPSGVLTMTYDLPGAVTRYGKDERERAAFHDRLLTRLRTGPGVVSAGVAARLPFAAQLDATDSQGLVRFNVGGRPVAPEERPFARVEVVSSGYLETLGVPILEGRGFDARDSLDSARVVLVSRELVRRYFARGTVIGTHLELWRTPPLIVGVVGDVKPTATALSPEPVIYAPMSQSPLFRTRLAVRTDGDPLAVLPLVRRVVASIDPELPVFEVRTLEQIAADAVAAQRFALLLFGLFGVLALGLSVMGIYGVLAYAVAHRLPELGVRAALGAAGSLVAAHWIRGLLYGIRPFDPLTLVAVAVLFALAAIGACAIPARRAARVSPLTAIRNS
jgi:predicted permease